MHRQKQEMAEKLEKFIDGTLRRINQQIEQVEQRNSSMLQKRKRVEEKSSKVKGGEVQKLTYQDN